MALVIPVMNHLCKEVGLQVHIFKSPLPKVKWPQSQICASSQTHLANLIIIIQTHLLDSQAFHILRIRILVFTKFLYLEFYCS